MFNLITYKGARMPNKNFQGTAPAAQPLKLALSAAAAQYHHIKFQ